MQTLVGEKGEVHSFEPVPPTFKVLEENVKSNINSNAVRLNNFALGEQSGEMDLHIFDDLPDGHASMSDFGKSDFTAYKCRVETVNSYLRENKINNVNFVKVDIEGAELTMLKGATNFFKQKIPPIFEIEMALDTTKGFGYLPNDIIEFIRSQYDYNFFAINEKTYDLEKIEKFNPNDIGANVLCIPNGHFTEVIDLLRKK